MQDGFSTDGRPPLGLMMAVAQNMRSMEKYAALDEQGRCELWARASSIHSEKQMKALVEHMDEFLHRP